MKTVFRRPESLIDSPFTYCPGCGHGIIHRLIAEVMDELGIRENTIGVVGVGCSARAWSLFNCDMIGSPHGRPGAVATGIKRSQPSSIIFTYQGDGDASSIGLAETMYAAIRGENITVIVVNNTVYAMTGGQMGPTSLEGQVTSTSPRGRDVNLTGQPFHLPEIIAQIPGVAYSARVAVNNVSNIKKAKKAILNAFTKQINQEGFTMVELLSPCPTVWRKKPIGALEWLETSVIKEFPLGEFTS